jgi:hypothetical protein
VLGVVVVVVKANVKVPKDTRKHKVVKATITAVVPPLDDAYL